MNKYNPSSITRILYASIFIFCSASLVYCSKDKDEPKNTIAADKIQLIATEVNGCPLSNGTTGSRFIMSIPYTKTPGVIITKVEYTSKFSSGSSSEGVFNVLNDGTDGELNISTCIRFASTSWNERSYVLVGSDGVKSNKVTIKISKPAGAF